MSTATDAQFIAIMASKRSPDSNAEQLAKLRRDAKANHSIDEQTLRSIEDAIEYVQGPKGQLDWLRTVVLPKVEKQVTLAMDAVARAKAQDALDRAQIGQVFYSKRIRELKAIIEAAALQQPQ